MSRLVHSSAAYLRTLQISKAQLFVFVEDGLQKRFHDRVIANELKKSVKYEVRAAKELPNGIGGKIGIIDLYKKLRKGASLQGEKFGKKFSCFFFLDKDVDDLNGKRLRSPHVLYTPTYDIEGLLLQCGDLAKAVADALGTAEAEAEVWLGQNFIQFNVEQWKEWTALCIISQLKKKNTGATFARPSAINCGPNGTVSATQLNQMKSALKNALGFTSEKFEALYSRYLKTVIRDIGKGQPLAHFKGKWFSNILQQHALNHPPSLGNTNSLGDKVMVALLGQVGHGATCQYSAQYAPALRGLTMTLAHKSI
ncbi:DUF4435 domain-containing protein [Massilia sp. 2TAF26]|uniref:DUF4435 domain-containing protein n=1 Tax=Massilia sp. 2TAF26 TaxID=3233012 RepID=UPI003F98E36D